MWLSYQPVGPLGSTNLNWWGAGLLPMAVLIYPLDCVATSLFPTEGTAQGVKHAFKSCTLWLKSVFKMQSSFQNTKSAFKIQIQFSKHKSLLQYVKSLLKYVKSVLNRKYIQLQFSKTLFTVGYE